MSPRDQTVLVGRLAGAFGVQGEVRLKSFCAQPEAILAYAPLTDDQGRSYGPIRLTGQAKGALIARIGGIDSREQAEALKGVDLFAPKDRLPQLPDDEFYHADLIGLTVVDTGGTVLGRVKAVHDHGAGDLLEIDVPGQASVLLPFTLAAVPTVDLTEGRIVADPPEGLF